MMTIFYVYNYGYEKVCEKDYLVPLSVGDNFIHNGLVYEVTKVSFDTDIDILNIYSRR